MAFFAQACRALRVSRLSQRAFSTGETVKTSGSIFQSDPENALSLIKKKGFIVDMDGVIYHGNRLLPGAIEFVSWLQKENKEFLFLTNSSERSPRELKEKLQRLGITVDASRFYTSALATASFLESQTPNGSAYVIGEPGLMVALYNAGFAMNEASPDYVVVGETRNYNFEKMATASNLVQQGARLIGTSCDVADRIGDYLVPSSGALIAPIELVTGVKAYFVGKPNPLMMRKAMQYLGCNREETVIIGDRMDTDIIAGVQSEIDTCLVLSGVTTAPDLKKYPFRPKMIAAGLFEVADGIKKAQSSGAVV